MAKWVLQSTYPSASKRARTRTTYLAGLVPMVDRIITDYFNRRPDGEDVTVEVLRKLGRDRLVQVAGTGQLNTAKQDVGLLVALRLVDLFGAGRVATYREDDGRRVSTRPARSEADWINRYTPHRLTPDATADRIVLDTNAVRAIVHGDPDALDLATLATLKGSHPVSIADHAWGELLVQLLEGRIPFKDWAARIRSLEDVLDPDLPIAPSGREAAAFVGLADDPKFDIRQMQAYYRAVWRYVASAKNAKDFNRTYDFEAPSGQRYRLGPLTMSGLRAAFVEREQVWRRFATKLAVGVLAPKQQDDLTDLVLASLAVGMDLARVDRLDLPARVLARYAILVNDPNNPYVPESVNDAIDFDVLFCTVFPGVVCTADGGMRKLAQASESGEAWRVMTPAALIQWLRGPVPQTAAA